MAAEPSVAVIGLGITGSRMARQLALHRFHVRGFDADAERLDGLSVFGGEPTGDVTVAVLRNGLAYSKAMDVWGDRMITGDHEPPFSRLRQSSKDAKLIVEQALALGAPRDLVEVVAVALTAGEADGLGDLDNSAILEVVRRRAGIGRVP